MRITTPMITNTMMLNINRNVRNVNTLYNQISTGKKIQVPSDDPILASRALKFRANLADTIQYQRNVQQGAAWMKTTEGAFNNMVDIMDKVRDLITEGASDICKYDDRKKIGSALQQLIYQIGAEMNVSYAGRYSFSGYRTDMPPILEDANANKFSGITQYFGKGDIETTKSFLEDSRTPAPTTIEYTKLPPGIVGGNFEASVNGNPVTIKQYMQNDKNAYNPAPGEINYIASTGEFIVGKDVAADIKALTPAANQVLSIKYDNMSVTPSVPGTFNMPLETPYASPNSTATNPPIVNDVSILKLAYKGDISKLTVGGTPATSKALTDPDAYSPGDDEIFYIPETGEVVLGKNVAAGFNNNTEVTYDKTGFERGDLNPIVYFKCTDQSVNPPKNYNTDINDVDYQKIKYEFGVNTRIDINSRAKDVYTDKMYADLRELVDLIERVNPSDEAASKAAFQKKFAAPPYNYTGDVLNKAVDDALKDQNIVDMQRIQTTLQNRFNNMLKLTDSHVAQLSKEQTDLGSRMNRLDFIESRLADDKLSFTQLMSENEDVDLMEAIMNRSTAEAVYQASLKAGASIIQMSLANFIG